MYKRQVLAATHRHDRPVVDTVILDYAQRSAQKVTVTGVKGGAIEIDMDEPVRLRTDDLLVLDDGSLVEVESSELKEGTLLVVGELESQPAGKPAPGGSPFTPQLRPKPATAK